MIFLAALAVFSGFSLNLLLSFALGTASIAGDHSPGGRKGIPVFQSGVLFISVVLLWVIFTHIFPFIAGGFFEYFLLFPVSALACFGFELLGERTLPRICPEFKGLNKVYPAFTSYDGLVSASLFITLNLAWNFTGALVLSLFFPLGNLLAIFILDEIRRRAALERVPRYLRGSPLVLISMGLLSFLSASLTGVFLKILEVF